MLKAVVKRILAKEGDFNADEIAILCEAMVDIKDISIRARIAKAIETIGSQSRSTEFHASKKPAKDGTTSTSSDDEKENLPV